MTTDDTRPLLPWCKPIMGEIGNPPDLEPKPWCEEHDRGLDECRTEMGEIRFRHAALVEALTAAKLPMVEPVGDRKTDPINSQRASWNAALDFALRAALDGEPR